MTREKRLVSYTIEGTAMSPCGTREMRKVLVSTPGGEVTWLTLMSDVEIEQKIKKIQDRFLTTDGILSKMAV